MPSIARVLDGEALAKTAPDSEWDEFAGRVRDDLSAEVVAVNRLTPTIVEVVVRAPAAARNFEPGQFFRLQNLESLAPRLSGSPLLIEPCALTGAWVDADKGLLSMIALEIGGSTRLCSILKPGEPVVAMGPTGTATELPRGLHRDARPAAGSATPCSSRSARRPARWATGSSISRATRRAKTSTSGRSSRPRPTP